MIARKLCTIDSNWSSITCLWKRRELIVLPFLRDAKSVAILIKHSLTKAFRRLPLQIYISKLSVSVIIHKLCVINWKITNACCIHSMINYTAADH